MSMITTGEYVNITTANKDIFIIINEANDKLTPDDVDWVKNIIEDGVYTEKGFENVMAETFPYGVQIIQKSRV